jgi:hypothetical protein
MLSIPSSPPSQVFLPRLPSSYPLPLTCPFHPNLDLLQLEDASKRKLSRTQWKCLTCGRVFASQQHVDEHIQHRHMQHAGANAVCLADFCDVLACKHRSVRYDPITGEQLLSGVTEGGLYGSAASRAAAKRKLSDVGGKGSKRAAEDRLAIPGALSAEEQKRRGSQPLEHPHADRCNAATMEVARMKCQAIMLQCFSNDEAAAAGGLSSAAVHALYEQFRADICDGLRCTPDGEYANAGLLAAQRSAESRSRLSTIGGFLLLFVLATFYCLVYSMRHEFGWTRAMPWGGAGGGRARSSLLAQAKEKSLLEKAQQWIGLQQKKRNTPSKLI